MAGNTLPKLQTSDTENLLILLVSLYTQQYIIDLMDKAYKAKEPLDSIDSYLLEELGIILPTKANNALNSRSTLFCAISLFFDDRFILEYLDRVCNMLE